MLKNLKNNYFSLVSIFLILYFFFNLMSGDRGLISYFDKKQILIDLQSKESKLLKNIEKLEFNILTLDVGNVEKTRVYPCMLIHEASWLGVKLSWAK